MEYMRTSIKNIAWMIACYAISACSSIDGNETATEPYGDIQVGNSTFMADSIATRATAVDATTIDWFKDVLSSGLSVTYGLKGGSTTKNAILKYTDEGYTLKYDNESNAQWLGNGGHVFQGIYIPPLLKESSTDFTNENNAELYTALQRYVSIPGGTTINATIDKITLPFAHSLACIRLYVLIDADVKKDYTDSHSERAKILGYDSSTGGGSSCSLRFKDARILSAISNNLPVWSTKDMVPHFLGENSIISNGVVYSNVPSFDLIVRPVSSNIDISFVLDNGLSYSTSKDFSLSANNRCTIYLHVTRKAVVFDNSMVETWVDERTTDNLGLSMDGSSWQQAYYIDGKLPDGTTLTEGQFVEKLKAAKSDGTEHGKYFILKGGLSLTDWTPFEFTGHLDGRGNTITVSLPTGETSNPVLFSGLNGIYDDTASTIHNANSPMMGRRAEVMNLTMGSTASLISGTCSGYLFRCTVTSPGILYGALDGTYGNAEGCITNSAVENSGN